MFDTVLPPAPARRAAPSEADLIAFRAHCLQVADSIRLAGWCTHVAVAVQQRWGDWLIFGRLTTRRRRRAHWWNLLPDGQQVDLTSSQFAGGDGLHPVPGWPIEGLFGGAWRAITPDVDFLHGVKAFLDALDDAEEGGN